MSELFLRSQRLRDMSQILCFSKDHPEMFETLLTGLRTITEEEEARANFVGALESLPEDLLAEVALTLRTSKQLVGREPVSRWKTLQEYLNRSLDLPLPTVTFTPEDVNRLLKTI